MTQVISPKQMLSGPDAFYSDPKYIEKARLELEEPLCAKETIYNIETESKVWRVVRFILSIIIFPVGLYWYIHSLVGRRIVIATNPEKMGYPANIADQWRESLNLESSWKIKRLAIKVDGFKIDAAIIGQPTTFSNGKWLMSANGNGEFYEQKLNSYTFKRLLSSLGANGIVFNYPGVGASEGLPTRKALQNAYLAILKFLEDQKKGLAAKEIFAVDRSLGGAVSAEALAQHTFKNNIRYVFWKRQTFGYLPDIISRLTHPILGLVARILNWGMAPAAASTSLPVNQIIAQTAKVNAYTDVSDQKDLIDDDGVIQASESLGKQLQVKRSTKQAENIFIGVPEGHNEDITEIETMAQLMEKHLASPRA